MAYLKVRFAIRLSVFRAISDLCVHARLRTRMHRPARQLRNILYNALCSLRKAEECGRILLESLNGPSAWTAPETSSQWDTLLIRWCPVSLHTGLRGTLACPDHPPSPYLLFNFQISFSQYRFVPQLSPQLLMSFIAFSYHK